MLSFAGGLVTGCFLGALGTLLFLLFANAIPDASSKTPIAKLPAWTVSAVVILVMTMCFITYRILTPHPLAFLAIVLLLLVLLTAKMRGMVPAFVALTFAAAIMAYILPPSNAIWIDGALDRLLLAAFVSSGLIGSRLVGRRHEIS